MLPASTPSTAEPPRPSISRILCATDLSDGSAAALVQADALAKSRNARLGVCHVVQAAYWHPAEEPFRPPTAGSTSSVPELEAEARAAVQARVASVTGRGPQDVDVFIDFWRPHVEIVKRAEAYGADLIVVGSHGSTGLVRILLGSVAERVVRLAHCPVLVARPSRGNPVVLAATDLSDPSRPAIAAAAEEARHRNAKLVVAHVLPLDPAPPIWLPPAPHVDEANAIKSTLDATLVQLGATGDAVVLDGDPATRIRALADQLGAELVVVATHGRTGIKRILLGSVAEAIIKTMSCSVLAVRERA